MRREYYVYAWLRPDGGPFYIGKGKGKRAGELKKHNPIFMRIVDKIKRGGEEPKVVKWHSGLSEEDAFKLEKSYIRLFGRKDVDTGVLANMTDGGEGQSGAIVSEYARELRRAKMTGRSFDDDAIVRMSVYASNRTPEHQAKLTLAVRNRDPSVHAKIAAANQGRKNSDAARQRMSRSQRARFEDPDACEKLAKARRNEPPRGCSKSGIKGVTFKAQRGAWEACLRYGGNVHYIGSFHSPEDAALAYDAAAYAAWGDDCYLNFPEKLIRSIAA